MKNQEQAQKANPTNSPYLHKYARKRQLAAFQNRVKDAKMLLALSCAGGLGFGGVSAWLLYPEISATTTLQNAMIYSVGAGGVVAFMFMTVPTIVYVIEQKNYKEFKKEYDKMEKD